MQLRGQSKAGEPERTGSRSSVDAQPHHPIFAAAPAGARLSRRAVVALQAAGGNRATSDLIRRKAALLGGGGGAPVGDKPANDSSITIAADKEADWWTPEWYSEFNVGHSWIKLNRSDGSQDSYGFWPANLGRGGGFDPTRPWKDVEGEVRHPDEAHQPTATKTEKVPAADLAKAETYAEDKKTAKYNLLSYNCTTFARAMYKIATGKDAPSAGLLIDDPNDLHASIEANNRAAGLDTLEGRLPPTEKKSEKRATP